MPRLEEMFGLPDGEYGPGHEKKERPMSAAQKTDTKGEPEPVVKTRKVSELVLTHDQMVAAVKEKYPEIGYGVIADAVYGCGRLSVMKFTWSEPVEATPITITVNGTEKVVTVAVLSYEDVVAMALEYEIGRPGLYERLPMLSVTYQIGSDGGSLIKGQTIKVVPGLRINAYDTSNA